MHSLAEVLSVFNDPNDFWNASWASSEAIRLTSDVKMQIIPLLQSVTGYHKAKNTDLILATHRRNCDRTFCCSIQHCSWVWVTRVKLVWRPVSELIHPSPSLPSHPIPFSSPYALFPSFPSLFFPYTHFPYLLFHIPLPLSLTFLSP